MKSYDLDKYRGIIIAMYSCYDERGEVDTANVRKLARHYAQSGVKGLYVGGSSGEGMLQNVEERKQVLQAVLDEVRGDMTVIAHVGSASTKESVQLAQHAEAVGADAISAVPSIYYRLSEAAVEQHWQAIIDSTSLPFIIYNIPQTTGFNLSMDLFRTMADQDKVIGVKTSAESTYELQQFKRYGGENFLVFNGPDEQYLAGRIMGADGGIGGTYGAMPELFLTLDECFRAGRISAARKWQNKVNEIITDLLACPSLYGACKAILSLNGVETGSPRMPLLPITSDDRDQVARINEKIVRYVEESRKERLAMQELA